MALLDDVKRKCRVTSSAYDDELEMLIDAAKDDLGITDISNDTIDDDCDGILRLSICVFCASHFGQRDDAERLKTTYDELKAQMLMSSAYTDWGDGDA